MTKTWRVAVDEDTCIGSGMCAGTAPDAFVLDGAHSRPRTPTVPADEGIRTAAACCPMEAISIADALTDEPVDLD